MTEGLEAGESRASRRLTAQGALTELGGELAFAAVSSLLEVGVRQMTMDLSQLTSVEDAGLCWLRRAWLQTKAVGGCLWTVGVAEHYRRLIPTSPPRLIDAQPHGHHAPGMAAPRTEPGEPLA
jgi:hypothetical protein